MTPAHLHAATWVDSGSDGYGADYDAAGNMTARAPSESASQQQLTWDNEGRLTSWQNAPSSPTSTAQYLYDGKGNRVEQQATSGGEFGAVFSSAVTVSGASAIIHILHIVCLPCGERESHQLGPYVATKGSICYNTPAGKVSGLAGVIASSERSSSEE